MKKVVSINAARRMREVEQDIAEFRTWREALFTDEAFSLAIESMPVGDRLQEARNLVAYLRYGWSIFYKTTVFPMGINKKSFIRGLAEIVPITISQQRDDVLCKLLMHAGLEIENGEVNDALR